MALTLLAADPPKLGPIPWPISPWVIGALFLGWAGVCIVLILIAWRFRWPWLLWIIELLLPEKTRPKRRRRQRRG